MKTESCPPPPLVGNEWDEPRWLIQGGNYPKLIAADPKLKILKEFADTKENIDSARGRGGGGRGKGWIFRCERRCVLKVSISARDKEINDDNDNGRNTNLSDIKDD